MFHEVVDKLIYKFSSISQKWNSRMVLTCFEVQAVCHSASRTEELLWHMDPHVLGVRKHREKKKRNCPRGEEPVKTLANIQNILPFWQFYPLASSTSILLFLRELWKLLGFFLVCTSTRSIAFRVDDSVDVKAQCSNNCLSITCTKSVDGFGWLSQVISSEVNGKFAWLKTQECGIIQTTHKGI